MRSRPSNIGDSGWGFPTLGQRSVEGFSLEYQGVCSGSINLWPLKKYHRVCFLSVRWPRCFVPWQDVQGVFGAEQLLLKDHTEKTFVYSSNRVIPLTPTLIKQCWFFSSDVVLCQSPDESATYKQDVEWTASVGAPQQGDQTTKPETPWMERETPRVV